MKLHLFQNIATDESNIISKKKELSSLIFKVINWDFFAEKLIRGIEDILNLKQIREEKKVIMLQQIPSSKIDQIFVSVIRKQIDSLDRELLEKSGLKLSDLLKGNICFCAIAIILNEITSVQNQDIQNQYKEFMKQKSMFKDTF